MIPDSEKDAVIRKLQQIEAKLTAEIAGYVTTQYQSMFVFFYCKLDLWCF